MQTDYLRSLESAFENASPKLYRKLENIMANIPYKEQRREEELRRNLTAAYNQVKQEQQNAKK
jgi:uncharacterized membrane protein